MEKSLLCWHWTRMGQNQFTIPHTKQLLAMGSPSCCQASQQKPVFRKELKKTDNVAVSFTMMLFQMQMGCCESIQLFAWIFKKWMMEAGFEGWSETEVNHKGQGGDPGLVTEGVRNERS